MAARVSAGSDPGARPNRTAAVGDRGLDALLESGRGLTFCPFFTGPYLRTAAVGSLVKPGGKARPACG